jgi:Ni2+-binding GTPase involved in maturation of urease and hydrogenase
MIGPSIEHWRWRRTMGATESAVLMVVGGFLGSGKTTAILAAARKLATSGARVAIVTNDQASGLVDTAAALGVAPTAEIAGGCFCCRLPDLEGALADLLAESRPDIILAEAVGSCTDLAATVVQPLRQRGVLPVRLGPLSVVADGRRLVDLARGGRLPRLPAVVTYLYERQLAEADLALLNKIDLLTTDERATAEAYLAAACPGATVLPISAATDDGLADWLAHFEPAADAGGRVLDLDYDRYAEAEACLGWLNLEGELIAPTGGVRWLERMLDEVGALAREAGIEIAHVKVWLATPTGAACGRLVDARRPPAIVVQDTPADAARVIVNARAATEPERLRSLVAAALERASEAGDASFAATRADSFSPARPTPTLRLMPVRTAAG